MSVAARAAALAIAAALLLPVTTRGQVFRAETNAVTVGVAVLNGRKPAAGLAAADFDLRDNGVAQTIASISVESLPIEVTLVLDLSQSMSGERLEGLRASTRQITALLRPADTVRVIAVQQVVRDVIPSQPGNQSIAVELLTARGSTALHDGLLTALMRRGTAERRQLVIAVTDGLDTASFAGRDVVEAVAKRSESTLQMLLLIENFRSTRSGIRLTGQAIPTQDSVTAMMDEFTPIVEPTGGMVLPMDPRDSLASAFKTAVEEFRQTYVLRYSPHGVAMPGWHDITVRVTKSGRYDVRARKGYFGSGLLPTAAGTRDSTEK